MNFATFDLNLLRILDAILSEGSTVKAGERLAISQSGVSSALSRLRVSLGDPLFVRKGNQLVATDYADALRDPVREELERLASILTLPASFDPGTSVATFRIAASDLFSELLMPQLSRLLSRVAPRARVQLIPLVQNESVSSFELYDADIAIIALEELPEWVSQEPLFLAPIRVIARANHPSLAGIALEETVPLDVFCDLNHVLFSPAGSLASNGDAALAQIGRVRHVSMTVPSYSGVFRAVGESNMIAMVPAQLADKLAESFKLSVFLPPMCIGPDRFIGVWHKRSDRTPKAAWIRDQVFGLAKELYV